MVYITPHLRLLVGAHTISHRLQGLLFALMSLLVASLTPVYSTLTTIIHLVSLSVPPLLLVSQVIALVLRRTQSELFDWRQSKKLHFFHHVDGAVQWPVLRSRYLIRGVLGWIHHMWFWMGEPSLLRQVSSSSICNRQIIFILFPTLFTLKINHLISIAEEYHIEDFGIRWPLLDQPPFPGLSFDPTLLLFSRGLASLVI